MAEDFDDLLNRLREMRANAQDTATPLKAAGVYMLGSIEQNFRA